VLFIFATFRKGFGDSFAAFLGIQVLICVLTMLPATVLFGMTFPMVVRLFTQSLYRVGSSARTTYANTFGAIVGLWRQLRLMAGNSTRLFLARS
jgi:hypothetical protein